jgi:hypothetical protein
MPVTRPSDRIGSVSMRSRSERAQPVPLRAQLLGGFVLQAKLRLQILRRGSLRGRRALPFQPRPHGAVGQLRRVARDRAVGRAIPHRAVRGDRQFHHHGEPVGMLVQRREIRRQIVRQHGKVLDAGVHGGAIRGGMPVDRRILGYVAIHVGDADADADIAVRQALGDFDLVQIARSVVVDGRPEQAAQIAYRAVRGPGCAACARRPPPGAPLPAKSPE